jgi:hypothetical protein
MPTALTLHPDEPVLQPPTAKIGFELIAHEPGNSPTLLVQMREERVLMAFDHIVERRFFRTMTAHSDARLGRQQTWDTGAEHGHYTYAPLHLGSSITGVS